jgi:hypothetical protein
MSASPSLKRSAQLQSAASGAVVSSGKGDHIGVRRVLARRAGGPSSGSPDDLALAAGLRAFGGSADLSGIAGLGGLGGGRLTVGGSLAVGRGGPPVIVAPGASLVQYNAATPPDPPTFVSQIRFHVENGTAG